MSFLVEALGWIGSVLLIASILQRRIVALRVLSLVSAVVLALYNGVYGAIPMVAMNVAIAVINVVYLIWPAGLRPPARSALIARPEEGRPVQ